MAPEGSISIGFQWAQHTALKCELPYFSVKFLTQVFTQPTAVKLVHIVAYYVYTSFYCANLICTYENIS